MAYFANGTEGLMYQERYCFQCANWKDREDGKGEGCPIWDIHLFHAYDLCNDEGPGKQMLDYLIPMVPHTFSGGITSDVAGECSMYEMTAMKLELR